MTTTTVTGKLTNPAAVLPARGAVTFVLVDYSDNPVIGFDTTDQTEIVSAYTATPGADGTWTQALTPNSLVEGATGPMPTAWRIIESGGGTDGTYHIIVPATGGPYWAGTLRTALVGSSAPTSFANLAVAGTFTYDGVALAAPPNDPSKFLASTGQWLVGGGAVSSVNGHVGTVVLNTSDVGAIPAAAAAAANGVATLDGSGLLTAGQFPTAIVHATRLDQFAAPTAAVAMGSQKLTGLAPGTASTDAATVGQLPTASRDPYTTMLGLVSQPYPLDTTNNDNLGASAGCLILALNRPGAGTITNLGLWLQTAGTGPGLASIGIFPAAGGARLAVTGDMSAQLTNAANNDTYQEAALLSPYTAADVDYYFGLFTNLAADAKIGGVYGLSGAVHIPTVKGNKPMLVITGLSSMPTTIDLSTAITAAAAYWIVGS